MRVYLIATLAATAAVVLAGCDRSGRPLFWQSTVPVTKPQPQQDQPPQQPIPHAGPELAAELDAVGPQNPASAPAEKPPVRLQDLAGGKNAQTAPATKPSDNFVAAPLAKTKSPGTTPEVVAQSAVQVNANFITVDDVLLDARLKLAELPRGIREATFRQQAHKIVLETIRNLVNEYLVSEEVTGKLSDSQKEEVNKEMGETERSMIAKAGGSRTHLEQLVLKEGTTLERMLKDYRRRVEVQVFLRGRFNPSIQVNRRLLWEYYQSHPDEFTTAKKVQMQTVTVAAKSFLPKSGEEPTDVELQAARKKAKDWADKAAAAINAGRKFEDVAREYSQDSHAEEGGLWPMMPAGSFRVAKVEAAAFELPESKFSPVLEEGDSFYIVRAAKVQPGATVSFEDAQGRIEDILRRQQYLKFSQEYYQKLMKRAVITQAEDFAERCVERAVERFWGKKDQ